MTPDRALRFRDDLRDEMVRMQPAFADLASKFTEIAFRLPPSRRRRLARALKAAYWPLETDGTEELGDDLFTEKKHARAMVLLNRLPEPDRQFAHDLIAQQLKLMFDAMIAVAPPEFRRFLEEVRIY